MFMQAVKKCFVTGPHRGRAVQNDNIETLQVRAMVPKRLPDSSLQTIAANRRPAVFPGYGQAESRLLATIFCVENRKHFVAAAFCFLEDAVIRRRIRKPASPSEAAVHYRACWRIFFRCDRDRECQCDGESWARPFARRLFNTRRPAFVAMRALKPCVRARFRLLGWNVRFILLTPAFEFAPFSRRRIFVNEPVLARKKAGKGTREAQFCQ